MPTAVSRKQFRLMQAILHGKVDESKSSGRGTPPKSVAAKYTSPGKDAPEQSGKDRGGTWTHQHHAAHHKKEAKKHGGKESKEGQSHRKEAAASLKAHRKDLKKAFEDFYKSTADRKNFQGKKKAAATIVINNEGQILLGEHKGGMSFPGGHMDEGDLGDFATTALRELKEEAGIIGRNPQKVWEGNDRGTYVVVYLIESWTGKPKHGDDLGPLQWLDPDKIDWANLRGCCRLPLKQFIQQKLGKSLKGMISLEKLESLEKNIIRQRGDAVLEVTHGDALKLIGTGMFRRLSSEVKGMEDESFKDVYFDTYVLSIRKHMSDIYSGRVSDGHKVIYQFTNKSLPELTAALMSVFEWYLPEDEDVLDSLADDSLPEDVLHGGIQTLIDNYKKHNIGNIYEEMETIREQIRNGMAIDLQQVEARIMKLFDKLESVVHTMSGKHNQLATLAGREIDELEQKLLDLQIKIDSIGKRSATETVTAFTTNPANATKIHDENYPYLSRPEIEISPNGKIKITFDSGWSDLEKQNFLHDMRAKAIKREKSNG